MFYFKNLILALILLGCDACESPSSTQNISHLSYFELAISDCGENHLPEIDKFVNMVDKCLERYDNIESRVKKNISGENIVIIHLQPNFIQ